MYYDGDDIQQYESFLKYITYIFILLLVFLLLLSCLSTIPHGCVWFVEPINLLFMEYDRE